MWSVGDGWCMKMKYIDGRGIESDSPHYTDIGCLCSSHLLSADIILRSQVLRRDVLKIV